MKVALVELSTSHEECMYTQAEFLHGEGHDLTLIIHPHLDISCYAKITRSVVYFNFEDIPKIKRIPLQFKLLKLLKTFDLVVFNTASSSKSLRNVAFLLQWHPVQCIGLLHDIKRLSHSFTQKIISLKIKKYLVLSDHLKAEALALGTPLAIESFYPIFFPSVEKIELPKKTGEVWICIPGRVFFERRSYLWLIKKLESIPLPQQIKFIILGNICKESGPALKAEIEEKGLSGSFVFFDRFIENKIFYNYLSASDYVMPLLVKESRYLHHKISGTFNLAFTFKKPLLYDEFYESLSDVSENGVAFNEDNFAHVLSRIAEGSMILPQLYQDKKWEYAYQKKKYINFIQS